MCVFSLIVLVRSRLNSSKKKTSSAQISITLIPSHRLGTLNLELSSPQTSPLHTHTLVCITVHGNEKKIPGFLEEHSRTNRKMFGFLHENGKRYSVDTDIIVCTMSIPISLSRLKKFKKYILVFNLIRT